MAHETLTPPTAFATPTSAPQGPAGRAELLRAFGDDTLSVQSFFRFCFVPAGRLALLKELAVPEDWGPSGGALLRYLAVHVRLAIEQDRHMWNGDQMVMTAGRLTNPTGAPLYVGLVRNQGQGDNPWVMNWVGERPSCAELPVPPDLGPWAPLDPGAEVAIAADLSDGERDLRGFAGLSPMLRVAALTGAVHWALHRGLAVPQLHGGTRGYFVPVFLTQREDLTAAPDLVAPTVVQGKRLIVRALLDPHVAYSPARVAVERWEQLPNWLVESWQLFVERAEQNERDVDGDDEGE